MTVTVSIPTALRSYTKQAEVHAEGTTLADVLASLDTQYPGLRFRIITEQDEIRRHIRIYINDDQAESLKAPLRTGDSVLIVLALSGG